MNTNCIFCEIAQGNGPASIVCENHLAITIMDLRQFHPGHVIVIPRKHYQDIRELDDETGAALISMASRVTRAVSEVFPNQGLSLWHSIGEAADQEVPHLHIHIHPRMAGDNMLHIYPKPVSSTDRSILDSHAEALRKQIQRDDPI